MSRREVEGKEAARKAAVLEGTVVVVTVGLAGLDCAGVPVSPQGVKTLLLMIISPALYLD